jgi:hypothetical protein
MSVDHLTRTSVGVLYMYVCFIHDEVQYVYIVYTGTSIHVQTGSRGVTIRRSIIFSQSRIIMPGVPSYIVSMAGFQNSHCPASIVFHVIGITSRSSITHMYAIIYVHNSSMSRIKYTLAHMSVIMFTVAHMFDTIYTVARISVIIYTVAHMSMIIYTVAHMSMIIYSVAHMSMTIYVHSSSYTCDIYTIAHIL